MKNISTNEVKTFMEHRYKLKTFNIEHNNVLSSHGLKYKIVFLKNGDKPFLKNDRNIDYFVFVCLNNRKIKIIPYSTVMSTFKTIIRVDAVTKTKYTGIDFNMKNVIHDGFVGYLKD